MTEGKTFEELQLTGQLNAVLENTLSSVKISTKVEMKTGKTFVEWEIKAKHADVFKAAEASEQVHKELNDRYGSK